MDHFKKEKYQSKTPKIIKLYSFEIREIEITFRDYLIFYGKQIIYNKI